MPNRQHPLRVWRIANMMTLDQMAALCGVTASAISRIETGSTRPSMRLAECIARVTRGEITANDFITIAVRPQRRSKKSGT
jgi:DNA-binding XRE family transcriptional regulator